MKVQSNVKHPILNSILWTICILLFYSAGGAIAQMTKQDKVGQLLIQGIAVLASVIAVFIYLRVKHQSPKELDFGTPGIGHLANCIGGQNVFLTILHVFWAFTFGIVFAEMYLLSKSIYPIVILHFLHDFFGYIQTEIVNSFSITLYACHVVILVIYCVLLWRKLFLTEEATNKNRISA